MVQELGGRAAETTNNKMELMGAIEALKCLGQKPYSVTLLTDSTYVIRGITQWIWAWKKRNWKTAEGEPVSNRELWEELSRLVAHRKKLGQLEWGYVRGHSNVPGNERVDEIAVSFSKGKWVDLFHGPLLQYSVALADVPDDFTLPEMKPRVQESAEKAPVWYLSLVNGQLEKHPDWKSCEARVKGRSGAKFKKVASPQEEQICLQSWGVKPSA